MRRAAALWILAGAASAFGSDPFRMEGPESGLVYHRATRSVRAIAGVPGAAHLDAPSAAELSFASVAPGGRRALVWRDGIAAVIDRSGSESRIEGVLDTPDRVAWNARGSVAALYSRKAGALQRLWLEGDSVQAESLGELGDVTALAISASGDAVYAAASPGGERGIYLLRAGDAPSRIAEAGDTVALAFDESANRLYAVDRAAGAILEVSGSAVALFAEADVRDAVGIASDGARLYVAAGERRTLQVYDIAGRRLESEIPLEFTPAGIRRLATKAPLFVLEADGDAEAAVWILDGRSASVYFVPGGAL